MRKAVAAVEGAWIAAAVCEAGRTDHAFGSVGETLVMIRWGY